jgi:hypothetical protein
MIMWISFQIRDYQYSVLILEMNIWYEYILQEELVVFRRCFMNVSPKKFVAR